MADPTLTRDSLLAEISRSPRATHPERAEKLLAEIERSLIGPEERAAVGVSLYWAHEIGMLAANFRSVFRPNGPMVAAIEKLEKSSPAVTRLITFPKS